MRYLPSIVFVIMLSRLAIGEAFWGNSRISFRLASNRFATHTFSPFTSVDSTGRPATSTHLYQLHFFAAQRGFHRTGLHAKPKRGAVVEGYRTVSVNCSKCQERLFRYKKKNGTKSNLIKCYVERIAEDSAGVLEQASKELTAGDEKSQNDGSGNQGLPDDLPLDYEWRCTNCGTQFARSASIHGLPALKLVGGKVVMTKK